MSRIDTAATTPHPCRMIRLLAVMLFSAIAATGSRAACGPDALNTSRVMAVDPAKTPRVGLKSFPDTLPLADKEVVLTFDDGPHPPTTKKVLAALGRECVRATFFLIGKHAAAHPALVKQIAVEGHTVAHHSYSHPSLMRIAHDAAVKEIEQGIAADEAALRGIATSIPSTPFFRFPGFESTPALLALLQKRNIAVFGADLWASDWTPMTPAQQYDLIVARLEEARRGIILFHDPKAQTAVMLPDFLRYLRTHGYKIVHLVPSQSANPVAALPSR